MGVRADQAGRGLPPVVGDAGVARAAELSAQLIADDISDYMVNTVERTVDDIAAEVLACWQSNGISGL